MVEEIVNQTSLEKIVAMSTDIVSLFSAFMKTDY